jgi:hypothetical protein
MPLKLEIPPEEPGYGWVLLILQRKQLFRMMLLLDVLEGMLQ